MGFIYVNEKSLTFLIIHIFIQTVNPNICRVGMCIFISSSNIIHQYLSPMNVFSIKYSIY